MNFTIDITKLDVYERCLAEANDPNFEPGSHGVAATYRDGCRGPMCSYARSTAQTRGPGYLSNDLIEYITIYLWMDAYAQIGQVRSIYEAPKNHRMFYARLNQHGLAADLENNGAQIRAYRRQQRSGTRKLPATPA